MPEIEIVADGGGDNSNALFGKYELGKLLGCGAFAKVFHARDRRSGQSVAVKVLNKKKLLANPALANNIKREISIMRRLSHPNIVRLHEVMATKAKIFFAMEFVKGGELFNKISKHGRLSEDLSRRYFQQLISAVGYCHAHGVYHRDLKPENLLIDENGNLKVSDFGLSALTDQIRPDGLLHTLCGTPAYVAPEILSKKGYEGAKVDVWSCGIVLFVLAAGYLPFNDPNLMNMYKKIYKGEYRCPRWMSPDLKRFISRLLDINPQTRITIDEILKDPWFVKGGLKTIKFHDETDQDDSDIVKGKEDSEDLSEAVKCLNAFDLISFSSGLDLSGLFDGSSSSGGESERFLSEKSPEKLAEEVEEFAKAENLRVKRKKEEYGFEMEGQNGKFTIGIYVSRLNDVLVVVEARRRGGDADCYKEMWNNKLRLQLISVCDQTPVATIPFSSNGRIGAERREREIREKRGRRGNPKTLDPVGEDDEARGVTGKEGKGFFACYILTSLSPRHKGHTYIGFTVNPRRRIRQHNGEITSGAYRTKRKRPWEMVLCIYGFPTNVSALQFEWAWQHPRESLAVREAAAAFKSFSGLASKIKLAYTMLTLPAWNSLNLTVNYFSTKYAHHGGLSPSLPPHMKVQVCAMDDLPCFTKQDNSSQTEDEESPDGNEEEDDDSSNQSQPENPTTSSRNDLYPGEKDLHDRHFEKPKEPETLLDDRLANFTGFGLLDESVEDEVSHSTVGSTEAMEKESEILFKDRLANFTGFGLLDESVEEEVSVEAMEKDRWRRSNIITPNTHEVEVIDLMTPSPSCRVGLAAKRQRVSEFIDLTRSPNFIEL